ncbi:MAG: DNA repair and recombination protein RadB [Halobacteriaceae archaeon]
MTDRVPTGCTAIDGLLDGGFERGTVSQVYGPPAAGKTNLALSAAVEAALDGGEAVYIDTEGLSIDRFRQLLEARTDAVEDISARIAIQEVHDFDEQVAAVRDVDELAPESDLVVLDSATGFYRVQRTADTTEGETLRQVADQVTHLLSLARRHDLAVLLTNQVYSDPDSERARPLGGHTLQHWTGTILRLERFRGGNRRATLEKHRSKPAGETGRFRITATGLDGVDEGSGPDAF